MTESKNDLRAAVSGSFHRHMEAISRSVHELTALSVRVLSPADPRVVAAQGEFLFVASDRVRSVRLVQDRHLESIRAANFVWLVCPDGYVGQSASMEIGYAAGAGVPIYGTRAPFDLTLREYVTIVPSLTQAVGRARQLPRRRMAGLLIDPHASIERAHHVLEQITKRLVCESDVLGQAADVYTAVSDLQAHLALPTRVQ
jgi:hypothetical protein